MDVSMRKMTKQESMLKRLNDITALELEMYKNLLDIEKTFNELQNKIFQFKQTIKRKG